MILERVRRLSYESDKNRGGPVVKKIRGIGAEKLRRGNAAARAAQVAQAPCTPCIAADVDNTR